MQMLDEYQPTKTFLELDQCTNPLDIIAVVLLLIEFFYPLIYKMQRIIKTDTSHKTITFAVLVPDEVDTNGDVISADEITKTAHNFMENLEDKTINVDHKP